jgi:hypothetical protein
MGSPEWVPREVLAGSEPAVSVPTPILQVTPPVRTPVRVWIRDIALTLASVCVLLWTLVALFLGARIGQAVEQVGTPADPAPTWECTPTPDWPC